MQGVGIPLPVPHLARHAPKAHRLSTRPHHRALHRKVQGAQLVGDAADLVREQRVEGSEARAEAAAKASSAFTALANVFFVSLAALITSLRSRYPRIGDERVRVAQHRADGP
jgi:hypothetical protein